MIVTSPNAVAFTLIYGQPFSLDDFECCPLAFSIKIKGTGSGGTIPTPLCNFLSLHFCVKRPCLLGHWEFKCTLTTINSTLGIDHPLGFTTAVSSHHAQCISYEYLLTTSLPSLAIDLQS